MQQAAWLELDLDDASADDGADPTQAEMDEQFEADVELAAAGDWEALGLDAPGAKDKPGFSPATVESFLSGDA